MNNIPKSTLGMEEKCEPLDHIPVWSGDGYFCSKCMIQFICKVAPQETCPHDSGTFGKESCAMCQEVKEEWENELDKIHTDTDCCQRDLIKSFIKQLREEAKREERLEIADSLKDWLLEDGQYDIGAFTMRIIDEVDRAKHDTHNHVINRIIKSLKNKI